MVIYSVTSVANIKIIKWQEYIEGKKKEYTEQLYKMILITQISRWCDHSPRVRSRSVKPRVSYYASQQTKLFEVMELTAELFQILKDDVIKVLHSICQQSLKTQQWPQDWKRSVFIPIPKKGNANECSNYHTIELISHASKVILKILCARFKKYVN